MGENRYLRLALPTPLRRLFDYAIPQGLDYTKLVPGMRVKVPFQSRELIGILMAVAAETTVAKSKIKPALAVLDGESVFTKDINQLCQWAADYYHYSLGEVFSYALPASIRKGKAIAIPSAYKEMTCDDTSPPLNDEQSLAVAKIKACQDSGVFLLDGVTGSGKTEVYLQVIDHVIKQQKQVLVLVPEISLTPQTLQRFQRRFNFPIVALHSGLSEKERFNGWLSARAGIAKIVIGTRSAIFTPFKTLGLIVVDEEHDASFKQQDRFRYHARDVAVVRAKINNIPVVLGSATPSLESLLNVKRGRYYHLSLQKRAGNAVLPQYQFLDLRVSDQEEGLSPALIQLINHHLMQENQVMLFLNRRGFAPVMYCISCGAIVECTRCDARMVYHQNPKSLHCHHCEAKKRIPKVCEKCQASDLLPLGLGTQRVEQVLKKHFPNIPIIRIDRDNTKRKNSLQELFNEINANSRAILLGTQMLAKGHHFPQVTLVGILDADSGFFSASFKATEQMGQLLIQVSGRAGREEKAGIVAIQTYNMESPYLKSLIDQGYHEFANTILREREKMNMPPYSYFAMVKAEARSNNKAEDFLKEVKHLFAKEAELTILGPVPAAMAKRKGFYCQQLLLKSNARKKLQSSLNERMTEIESLPQSKGVKWILDVDPIDV